MHNRRNVVYLLIIISLISALFTGRAVFFNLVYMLVAILLVALIWSWFSVQWIGIYRRTRSSRAQVGRLLEESFVVRNRTMLPKLWLEVRDHSDLPGHRASQVVPAMWGRTEYQWQAKTLCRARGEFQLGPMTLTSGDPFGLFVVQRRLSTTSRIMVYPAVVQIDRFELPMGVLSGGEAQRRRSHYITTNASGVREYVSGDSFNRIHWLSSARKDRLMVKEFEVDPLVDIWLFADFSQSSLVESPSVRRVGNIGSIIPSNGRIPPSTEEYVAVVAASLAQYFINLERAVGFAAYTPNREIHQPDRGSRQLTRILECLSVARSFSSYTLAQMLTLETPYFTRGTTLVIVTASVDKTWVREAQILKSRGIQPVCVLVDPKSFGGESSTETVLELLRLTRIPAFTVRYNEDIAAALSL
jgi:uncharacterized protein (DUF58 family)